MKPVKKEGKPLPKKKVEKREMKPLLKKKVKRRNLLIGALTGIAAAITAIFLIKKLKGKKIKK